MTPRINAPVAWTINNVYQQFHHTHELQYPDDVFSLELDADGRLYLGIKERYAIEIMARLLNKYNYQATIHDLDYCPFSFLRIGVSSLYAKYQ